MRLVYLTANAAWAFTWGNQLVDLEGFPMFFQDRREAVEAARVRGLAVSRSGEVSALD